MNASFFSAWVRIAAGLATLLGGSESVAAACGAYANSSAYYVGYISPLKDAGDGMPMSTKYYANGTSTHRCTPSEAVQLEISIIPPAVGIAASNTTTFETGVPGVGMQFIPSVSVTSDSGTRWNLGSRNLTGGDTSVLQAATGRSFEVFLEIAFVRTGTLVPGNYTIPQRRVISVKLNGDHEISFDMSPLDIVVPAQVCRMNYLSGSTISLGSRHVGELPNVGDRTMLAPFTWSVNCSSARNVAVTYQSLTPVTNAAEGRMALEAGGAAGVELELRRRLSAQQPEGEAVQFGTSYVLGSSTGLVESMGVRLVRTGSLLPGSTDGGITINLAYP